jgi:hypothetical protein
MKSLVFVPIVLALGLTACTKRPEVVVPRIIKVPVPVKPVPIFLPARPVNPLRDLTKEMDPAKREAIYLQALRLLLDHDRVLEEAIRTHNESVKE